MEKETMKAWVITGFGGPEVYQIAQVPIPEPGEGEVQVKVQGAGLNPVDYKVRAGLYPPAAPKSLPAITLREFSGTISKLGAGVEGYEVGDGVYGITNSGAAAEYAVAATSAIARRPASMDPADAGVVPLAGMTAYQALFDHGHLVAGQRVLIHAASGGVGTFAVQLAKWAGAYVIGTASSEHHSVLRELGVDELIDYKKQKFEEVVRDIDLVLHSIGADAVPGSLKVLKPGGRLVAISADPMSAEAEKQGKTSVVFSMTPKTEQLRKLSDLIEDLKVLPVIDTIVPLERGPEAMAELEAGHTLGKIGIRI